MRSTPAMREFISRKDECWLANRGVPMATTTLHEYLKDLHFQGAINLDTPLRALVSAETLQIAPAAVATTYPPTDIFIGRRYVYITLTGGNPQLAGVAGAAEHVRAATTGQQ